VEEGSRIHNPNNPCSCASLVLKVEEKQWATKGLTRWDANCGSGDRGGENMGNTGVHAIMEESNESYVGKICLAHLSWRVCDAGIRLTRWKKVEAIETYVRDGITWSRLKTIATGSLEHGCLALFAETSEEGVNFFNRAPPKILDDRPETNCFCLEWLLPRQDVLAKLVVHDLSRRNLTMPQAQQALASLTDRMDCVLRHIDLVLIKKGLYLYYLSKDCHTIIDGDRSYEDVLKKALEILTNKFVDDHVLEVLGLTWADLREIGWTDHTNLQWIEVAILMIPGIGQADCNEMFEEVVKYHDMVAIKMATHLQGVALSIETRGVVLASQILSKDPAKAQNGAQRLRDHIVGTHPDKRSKFDSYILNSHDLWSELLQFAIRAVACVVWHGDGAFQHLFVFLAVRLATAPDTVLDCEGTHAKWQWLMNVKRGISFKMLVAMLKLFSYIQWHGELPTSADLTEHVLHYRRGMAVQVADLRANGVVPRGALSSTLYAERFGLNMADVDLIKDALIGRKKDPTRTAVEAWGMYVRWLFRPGFFYKFTNLPREEFLFVAENKSFAGRDEVLADDAAGRALSVAWFTATLASDSEIMVVPVAGGAVSGRLEFLDCTVAEIARAAGDYPAVSAEDTARQVIIDRALIKDRVIELVIED
jgi:hypothetical protein